jgi:hypothetical protein
MTAGGYCEMMAKDVSRGDLGVGDVQVTIVVTPGPVHAKVATLSARRSARVGLVVVVLAAVAAGGLIIASASSGPARVERRTSTPSSPQSPSQEGVAAQFAVQSHCMRRALFSRDGTFARVDFDRSPVCGAAGNHVTLIFRRVRRAWIAEFDATGGMCPANALPPAVLAELHLCPARAPH